MVHDATLSVNGSRADVLASLQDILDVIQDDRPIVEFPVPEWNGKLVLLRAMSQDERDDWELRTVGDWNVEPDEKKRDERLRGRTIREISKGMKALLVAHCLVGHDGVRLLSNTQAMHLQQANAAAINRLAERCNELCGFSDADLEKVAAAAKKDSETRDGEPPSA